MALYAETRARGDLQFEMLTPAYFTGVLARMGERAACVLYFADDRLLAVNLVLVDQGVLLDKFFCMSAEGPRAQSLLPELVHECPTVFGSGIVALSERPGGLCEQASARQPVDGGDDALPAPHRLADTILRLASPLLAPDVPEAAASSAPLRRLLRPRYL
ncbi:hypothetical protein ACRAWD_15820 [Caulobacter segnis]